MGLIYLKKEEEEEKQLVAELKLGRRCYAQFAGKQPPIPLCDYRRRKREGETEFPVEVRVKDLPVHIRYQNRATPKQIHIQVAITILFPYFGWKWLKHLFHHTMCRWY